MLRRCLEEFPTYFGGASIIHRAGSLPVVVDLSLFGELARLAGPLDDVAALVGRHQVALVGGQRGDGAGVQSGPLSQVQRPGHRRVRVKHQH